MLIVVSFAILLLALAVVVLFAMLGELASRTGVEPGRPSGSRELLDANIGDAPSWWPEPLDGGTPPGFVLVLSTSCGACLAIGKDLRELGPDSLDASTAIVISCPSLERGKRFIEDFHLTSSGAQLVVDDHGEWTKTELQIEISPAIVTFEDGVVRSAYAFSSVDEIPPIARTTSRALP